MAKAYLSTGACISPCGTYRYWLSRQFGIGSRSIMFVGLNPSTADETLDDPTIRRCVSFAMLWGYDRLYMGNVYALRSTDPRLLYTTTVDPVGPDNLFHLNEMAVTVERIVAAWGANKLTPKAKGIADWLKSLNKTYCLGQNMNGTPKHPLYISSRSLLRKMV